MPPVHLDLPKLRTSERKAFKRCPQRWWWSYREGLVPANRKAGALWFGTGIHLALEKWYIPGTKRGADLHETWKAFVDDRIVHVKAEMLAGEAPDGADFVWIEAGELGNAMFDNYLKTYGQEEHIEVISPEQTFQVLIPKPGTREPIVNYVGTFDLVARDHEENGRPFLWDHKTAKSIQTKHLPLDDQAGSYWAVANHVLRQQGLIGPKENLRGIVYNFLMKSPPDPRPENEFGQKCNAPTKPDYVEALRATYADMGLDVDAEIPGLGKTLEKATLKQLKTVAEDEFKLTVLGEVSKTQPSKRFLRETVYRTPAERKTQIERIGSEAAVMDMYRYGELPIIKNPTTDCSWDCDFFQLCRMDEEREDTEEYISEVFRVEDPYAAHLLGEQEVQE